MKTWLLLTIGLAAIGCATPTAAGPATAGPPPGWVAAGPPPSEAAVETDGAPGQPRVVVAAMSPTEIRYRVEGETIVPIQPLHPPGPSIRRVRTRQGMWIGAAIGVIAGLALPRPPADDGCEFYCGRGLAAVGFGAIGLGLGAAVGAILGTIEGP